MDKPAEISLPADEERSRVWPYFLEWARREVRLSRLLMANPERMSGCCDYYRDNVRELAVQKPKDYAEQLFRYFKQRASLKTQTGLRIDPFQHREWQAMLRGTYIQWWRREKPALCATDTDDCGYLLQEVAL